MDETQDKYLTTAEAAKLLNRSIRQLEWWRISDRGPPYYRPFGKCVRYLQSELKEWHDKHCRVVPSNPRVGPSNGRQRAAAA